MSTIILVGNLDSSLVPNHYVINLAGLSIEIDIDCKVQTTSNFIPFLNEEDSAEVKSMIHAGTDVRLKGKDNILLYSNQDYDVWQKPSGIIEHYYKSLNQSDYYAVSRIIKPGLLSEVEYTGPMSTLNGCFAMTAWEQMLMWHDRMILHSSCIQTSYGGILFSGVSGIGKSTQADLWIKYREARLINGDRTILFKKEGLWHGYGSPFAGSSRCYLNENVQLKAIVMLAQNPENSIRRLPFAEAFRMIYAGTTIYIWDRDYVERAVSMIMQLISDVPVLLLSCTPDERAVSTLEEYLINEGRLL